MADYSPEYQEDELSQVVQVEEMDFDEYCDCSEGNSTSYD